MEMTEGSSNIQYNDNENWALQCADLSFRSQKHCPYPQPNFFFVISTLPSLQLAFISFFSLFNVDILVGLHRALDNVRNMTDSTRSYRQEGHEFLEVLLKQESKKAIKRGNRVYVWCHQRKNE
ncbi:hypothetical protein P5673_027137 [Acropora cervicornis]|uniref:Uncharacterized protein n=1 Tax=Acropora cervicornis TaxID=6130 RepID=A0AAD9PZL0_ACRCE|nr:hypothetical protein P5673_027137 [Acropora cervicornis]